MYTVIAKAPLCIAPGLHVIFEYTEESTLSNSEI